MEKIMEASRYL